MNSLRILTTLSLLAAHLAFAQTPKRELRGAWIATVSRIDWPSSNSPAAQKVELTGMLDKLKSAGINSVYLQVRDECDALYQSDIEPWSSWLTGTQGKAPSPLYDPLAFAITEAHARGMELHAWLNPYRAEVAIGSHSKAANHVTNLHPNWILTFSADGLRLLNPGLPEVRDYVTSVVTDIVTRYDVDGIHFDDYFYPYSGITTQDAATFSANSRGITDVGDWRRDNINLLVEQVYKAIAKTRSHVKFGISPFGIWKSGVPAGISGLSGYSAIYADALAWLNAKTVDYITPQLYWRYGGNQDYGKLMPWWADQVAPVKRHLYTGHAAYLAEDWGTASVVAKQVRANRDEANCQGSILFSAVSITDNLAGMLDTLKRYVYTSKALPPIMAWKDTLPPTAPRNLKYSATTDGKGTLEWEAPLAAADGDSAFMYVVYKIKSQQANAEDFADSRNIREVLNGRTLALTTADAGGFFFVTSLDRNANESGPSNPGGATVSLARISRPSADGTKVLRTSQGRFSLTFEGALPLQVDALDLQGRVLASLRPRKNEESLRIDGYGGIYILQVYQADGGMSQLRVSTVKP